MSILTPTAFRALRDQRLFEITWNDGRVDQLSFFDMRCACPCASCIHEITGEQILRPELVPHNVAPVELAHSGNYAVKIVWSDGHASGIYTWDRLRELGDISAESQG
jgi:DUF971 family protein